MTCRFIENDVLFYWKRRVVFFRWWVSHFSTLQEYGNNGKLNCENTYNNTLSRVRVRTHNRSFIIFAVTSVTDFFLICYNTRDYPVYEMNFNKSRRVFLKKTTARPSKNVYFAANLSSISTHFPSVLTLSVTLVTAKKQHRCWKACAYACARDCLLTLDTCCKKKMIVLQYRVATLDVFQRKKCRFLRFFHSLPSFQCLYV